MDILILIIALILLLMLSYLFGSIAICVANMRNTAVKKIFIGLMLLLMGGFSIKIGDVKIGNMGAPHAKL